MPKVLNSAEACWVSMGDVELVRILGTDNTPHKPTELESFVDEIAAKNRVDLKTDRDGMQVGSWVYEYRRKGKRDSFEIEYELLCFAAQEGEEIPVEQAVNTIKENLAKRVFDENLWVQDKSSRLYILRAPWIEAGRYSASENGRTIGRYDLKKLRILVSQVF